MQKQAAKILTPVGVNCCLRAPGETYPERGDKRGQSSAKCDRTTSEPDRAAWRLKVLGRLNAVGDMPYAVNGRVRPNGRTVRGTADNEDRLTQHKIYSGLLMAVVFSQ